MTTKTNLGISAISAAPNYFVTVVLAAPIPINNVRVHHILKFNGDLIELEINKMPKIIDYNVINIDYHCYVTNTELYYYCNYKYESKKFPLIESLILNIQYIQTMDNIVLCQFYTSDAIYFN